MSLSGLMHQIVNGVFFRTMLATFSTQFTSVIGLIWRDHMTAPQTDYCWGHWGLLLVLTVGALCQSSDSTRVVR